MRIISFSNETWSDYLYLVETDKKILKRVNSIIEEIRRTPFKGIGNPEPLKNTLSGFWSRRLNLRERIVYKIEHDKILIISCRGHYE